MCSNPISFKIISILNEIYFFFSPSSELLRPILCRDCKRTDYFTVSILNYWAQEFEDKLADLIYTQFSKVNGGTPNKKRQR